jgi:predicted ester cyclase
MSNSENVEAVRKLFDAFYAADDSAMSTLIGDDFVTHAGTGTGNAEGWKAMAAQIVSAVPDVRTEIEDIFGDGDRVAVRYTSRGTHTGELFGVPATNRALRMSGMEIYRFSARRIVECWGVYDMGDLFSPSQ